MGIKITDLPKIEVLNRTRSALMRALAEIPQHKADYRRGLLMVCDINPNNVGEDDDAEKGHVLATVSGIPAKVTKMFLEAQLSKVETELAELGVDLV